MGMSHTFWLFNYKFFPFHNYSTADTLLDKADLWGICIIAKDWKKLNCPNT